MPSELLSSIYERRTEDRDALLAAGAEVGPLEAAALGDVERLRDADLSVRGDDGFTPLHLAAFFGGAEAVRTLLARGMPADADAENDIGVRPIHSAAAVGDHESVRALLEAGADPNVKQQQRAHAAGRGDPQRRRGARGAAARPRRRQLKWTLPLLRARAWARSMKSRRLSAARHRRATSFIRADSERRSSRPCLASRPNSTVAAIS